MTQPIRGFPALYLSWKEHKKYLILNVLRNPSKSGYEAVTFIWIIKKTVGCEWSWVFQGLVSALVGVMLRNDNIWLVSILIMYIFLFYSVTSASCQRSSQKCLQKDFFLLLAQYGAEHKNYAFTKKFSFINRLKAKGSCLPSRWTLVLQSLATSGTSLLKLKANNSGGPTSTNNVNVWTDLFFFF